MSSTIGSVKELVTWCEQYLGINRAEIHEHSLNLVVEYMKKKVVIPKGTLVRYWKGAKEGIPSGVGYTRTEVQDMYGIPVVWIENVAGFIAVSHVEVVEEEDEKP